MQHANTRIPSAAEYVARAQGASEVKLTPEEIENLRALGYVDSDE